MSVSDWTAGNWRKSSYSGGGNDCVEIAAAPRLTAVRDSKNPDGPRLHFTAADFAAFLEGAKHELG
ncbi:MAG TPA: DUF397 domain-containing protein [Pseudonocardiaceae bacterium]|nr:DUF397 domain-containing protein [Pseudonocardiaceae bacterium]